MSRCEVFRIGGISGYRAITSIARHSSHVSGRRRVTVVLSALGLIFATTPSSSQIKSDASRPTVRISSPFAAPLWRVDNDTNEAFAVVSNAGNALTIWPLADVGRPLTVRLPLRNEQRRRAHAVAISGNAELVAYSVPPVLESDGRTKADTAAIYIIRRATGRILQIIDGPRHDIATRPQSLRFSPDGVHLAAVLSSGCGVRLWTTRDWKLVFKDDKGYGGEEGIDRCCRFGDTRCDALPDTTGVQFLKPTNGKPYLVTAGESGVRVYDKAVETIAFRVHASPGTIDLERPSGISASPDGGLLLIGDRRDRRLPPPLRIRLAVIDASTLKPSRAPLEINENALLSGAYLQGGPQVDDISQSSLDRVTWLKTPTDEFLFGAGVFPCEAVRRDLMTIGDVQSRGNICMARWSLTHPDAEPRFIPVGSERVIDVAALPLRQGLLIASQKRISIIDADGVPLVDAGKAVLDVPNTIIDFRDGDLRFRISPDGRTVEMEDYRVRAGLSGLLTFDLGTLSAKAGDGSGVARIDSDQGQDAVPPIVENWRNVQGSRPRILGRELGDDEVRRDEIFRAVAVNRQQQKLALASSEFIRVVSYSGGEPRVLCREPITEEAYRLNLTPDGTLIISGHSDGTLRWYRVHPRENGCQLELLVSLHLSETTAGRWTWAAWRPSGLYARDMDSELRLEWQRTTKDGQVGSTEFHRLLLMIDRDAIRGAIDPLAQIPTPGEITQSQVPDLEALETEQRLEPIVEVSGSEADRNVAQERISLRLAIAEGKGWPKRLDVKLSDETPLAKIYRGKPLAPEESLLIQQGEMVAGTINLDVLLPSKARIQANADFQLCFFVDDGTAPDTCHKMRWQGVVAQRPPRRLWALFIGVSKAADGSGLDLNFPENDAIDLARLFISDFEHRVEKRTTSVLPDFARIQVNLAVSAFPAAAKEIGALSSKPYVVQLHADKADIAKALQKVAQDIAELNRSEPGEDLFLMTYAGHGMADPNRKGGSAFLTADATARVNSEKDLKMVGAKSLTSQELLHLLRQIPARKVIILDACRSLVSIPTAQPFSPELMRAEFEKQSLDAHFFFASDAGQESFELAETAFDISRPKERQGNGLFTFALLKALTTPRANAASPSSARRIEIPWLADFLRNRFFDRANPRSPANLLKVRFPSDIPYIPEPKYIAARSDNTDQLIRTLEDQGASRPPK